MQAVKFLVGARADFDESFDWYAKRSVNAALRFAGAVDAALINVAANTTRFASPDGVHRECPVKAFPFRVVYRIVENELLIVAIAHAKRRPGYWRGATLACIRSLTSLPLMNIPVVTICVNSRSFAA